MDVINFVVGIRRDGASLLTRLKTVQLFTGQWWAVWVGALARRRQALGRHTLRRLLGIRPRVSLVVDVDELVFWRDWIRRMRVRMILGLFMLRRYVDRDGALLVGLIHEWGATRVAGRPGSRRWESRMEGFGYSDRRLCL